jgi:nucleoside-diphosphate-sugar epimerase
MFPEIVRDALAQLGGSLPAPGALAEAERLREPLPLLRSHVAPEDAARAFRLALELPRVSCEVLFVAAADTFQPSPTLAYLREAFGALPEVRKPDVYARDPRASAHDSSRARELLGWSPSTTWPDLVARATAAR